MKMPFRNVSLRFHIDSNRINARQKSTAMNLLERWHQNDVIRIDMCDVAQEEASKGSAERFATSAKYVYPRTFDSHINSPEFKKIKRILFPTKTVLTANEKNDVIIVFHAKKEHCILVTNDGGSNRQPNGILVNRERLKKELEIKVKHDTEAVALVKKKILERDERARRIATTTGEILPKWVGIDSLCEE